MLACLVGMGWVELANALEDPEQSLSSISATLDAMSGMSPYKQRTLYAEPYYVTLRSVRPDEEAFQSEAPDTDELAVPSVSLFYASLYAHRYSADYGVLTNCERHGSLDFERFRLEGTADFEDFLHAVLTHDSMRLIYPGSFARCYRHDEQADSSKARWMRTVNALCVDVDSDCGSASEARPIPPWAIKLLFSRLPSGCHPSFISLSGTGMHCWYVFDHPVQLFRSDTSPRRRKFKVLAESLYALYRSCSEGLPIKYDHQCETYCHAMRAPGSATKYGGRVVCLSAPGHPFQAMTFSPVALCRAVADGATIRERDIITPMDTCVLTPSDLETRLGGSVRDRLKRRPATAAQLDCLKRLLGEGRSARQVRSECDLEGLDEWEASQAIRSMVVGRAGGRDVPLRPGWTVRPHRIAGGRDKGIYAVVRRCLPQVKPGGRYLAMFCLAGVAYMTSGPEAVTRRELEADLIELVRSDWGSLGEPLTMRDVRCALGGYCAQNWQTRRSIVRTLGFDPFGEPAKRNGRTRGEHIAQVAAPASARSRSRRCVEGIAAYLASRPQASMREVSKALSMSRTTVSKYWEEAKSVAFRHNADCDDLDNENIITPAS